MTARAELGYFRLGSAASRGGCGNAVTIGVWALPDTPWRCAQANRDPSGLAAV